MRKLIDLDTAIDAVLKESNADGAYGYMDTKSIVDLLNNLPSAQSEYEPVKAEDFAKTMSENTFYGFMVLHSEALELMERQGFVICKDVVIYKQAAIDAVEKHACNTQRILDAISALPSAQPEIVRCKDCIYWWETHKMCKRNKDKSHNCACMDCDADFYCGYAKRKDDE